MQNLYIVCFKWGTLYGSEYVNNIYRAARKYSRRDPTFFCVTDSAAGLDKGVQLVDLLKLREKIPEKYVRSGNWQKLLMYSGHIFEDRSVVLYFDLDIVMLGDIDPLFDRVMKEGGLHICKRTLNPKKRKNFNPNARYMIGNSSVVGFIPGEQRHIFQAFLEASAGDAPPARREQEFVCSHADRLTLWPDHWVLDFKSDCVRNFPLNLLSGPKTYPETKVVIFPGSIKPAELTRGGLYLWGTPQKFGFGDVRWIRDYWLPGSVEQTSRFRS